MEVEIFVFFLKFLKTLDIGQLLCFTVFTQNLEVVLTAPIAMALHNSFKSVEVLNKTLRSDVRKLNLLKKALEDITAALQEANNKITTLKTKLEDKQLSPHELQLKNEVIHTVVLFI